MKDTNVNAALMHYATVAFTVAITAIGVGIGQGITSSAAIEGINRQPSAQNDIMKTAILAIALIETAAVMGTFISFLLLLNTRTAAHSLYSGVAELGIAAAISFSGCVLGLVSAFPARAACLSVARQPFFSQMIVRFMMISLSLLQTPIIFGLIIALFIHNQVPDVVTWRDSFRLLASGLCMGLGSIGPAIGLALFARTACEGIGINRKAYTQLFSFTLISQAIIETPIIFSLIISIALLFLVPPMVGEDMIDGMALLAAGLCTGIGTFGPGLSSGRTAMAACEQIAIDPSRHGTLSRLSMFAQGLIETSAIYAVLISFLLIFFR